MEGVSSVRLRKVFRTGAFVLSSEKGKPRECFTMTYYYLLINLKNHSVIRNNQPNQCGNCNSASIDYITVHYFSITAQPLLLI